MASLAEQLIQAFTQSGAPKMCITTPGSNAFGAYQQPMQITVELLNKDGTSYSLNRSSSDDLSASGNSHEKTEKRQLENADLPDAKKRRGSTKTRRNRTKVLDMAATLLKYEERIRALEAAEFSEFNDAYITDYKLHQSTREDSPPTTHAYLLGDIAKEHGHSVLGYVSSNRKDGKYMEALPDGQLRKEEGGTANLVYVGDKNQFTNQAVSKWAILKSDKVFKATPAL